MASAPVTSAAEMSRATWLYDCEAGGGPMHTDSSARRTWRLSRSASLKTATVEISSSRHARIPRSAISPRFAISTLRNTVMSRAGGSSPQRIRSGSHGSDRGFGVEPPLLSLGVHRPPHPVGGGGDALELERELVRIVTVPKRLLLGDLAVVQQAQHRLVEGLHPVLGEAVRDR